MNTKHSECYAGIAHDFESCRKQRDDLLAALEEAMNALDNSAITGRSTSGATDSMRAAIAKAKG